MVGVAGSVRENVRLRRGFRLAARPGGLVGVYLHQSVAPGLGRIAGLVALEASPPLAGEAAAEAQVRAGRGRWGLGGHGRVRQAAPLWALALPHWG